MRRIRSRRALLWLCVLLVVVVALIGAGIYSSVTALSYGVLVAQLQAAGATVAPVSNPPADYFSGAGRTLAVNGEDVEVYEYAVPLAADLDASRVSSDCSTFRGGFGPFGAATTVDWIAPPHCYKRGRVIVMYIGRNVAVIRLLSGALGRQFAGGS